MDSRGARVLGVGDQPLEALPSVERDALSAYLQVAELWHAPALIDTLRRWDLPLSLDRVNVCGRWR